MSTTTISALPHLSQSLLDALPCFNKDLCDLITNLAWEFGGKVHHTLQGHSEPVMALVSAGKHGKWLASGSWDSDVRIWDVETGWCLHTLKGHRGLVDVMTVFGENRKRLATAGSHTVRVWNVETGECLRVLEGAGSCYQLAAVNNDKWIVCGSGENQRIQLVVRDLDSGECVHSLDALKAEEEMMEGPGGVKIIPGHFQVYCMSVFGDDGTRLAAGYGSGAVRVWNVISGKCLHTMRHTDTVTALAVFGDGKWIASGSWDKTVRVWDAESGECIKAFVHEAKVWAVVVGDDGKWLASATEDHRTQVWDVKSGKFLHSSRSQHRSNFSLAVFGNGKTLAIGTSDGIMQVWDGYSGECFHTMEDPIDDDSSLSVDCVTVLCDGKCLAAAYDERIIVWE